MSEENEPKKISIKEFREEGFLQELNRRFLHPLGLALEVIVGENGEEALGGVWDSRDDPEGFIYDLKNSDLERLKAFAMKRKRIQILIEKSKETRQKTLGYVVEPIPDGVICEMCGSKNTNGYDIYCKDCRKLVNHEEYKRKNGLF